MLSTAAVKVAIASNEDFACHNAYATTLALSANVAASAVRRTVAVKGAPVSSTTNNAIPTSASPASQGQDAITTRSLPEGVRGCE